MDIRFTRYHATVQLPLMTIGLAHRIERALALAAESRIEHIRRLPGNPLSVEVRQWQRLSAILVRRDAHYYPRFNAIRGLGRGDEGALDEALGWFRSKDRLCSVVVSPFEVDDGLLCHLADRGVRLARFMSVLYGVPQRAPPSPTAGVTVRAFRPPDLDHFLALWLADTPETEREFLSGVGRAEFAEWRCYVASLGRSPAGIGGLYLRDGIGVLAAGATLPEFRRRGCQTALLHRRLADAAEAGCDLVLSQAKPGSVSQRNLQRVGLGTAYTQAIWVDQLLEPGEGSAASGSARRGRRERSRPSERRRTGRS